MTQQEDNLEFEDIVINPLDPARLAYIKPTPAQEAKRLGIVPPGIKIPDDMKLFVLHASDGRVLGFTDAWESAYGAALQNELTPLSLH
ncbi:MAG: DUF1150 family protein [Rhizomicrobium sp.]|jgi:hypothetical protein